MNKSLISIKEFRRIAGKSLPELSDHQIDSLISSFEFMAEQFIYTIKEVNYEEGSHKN